MSTNPFSAVCGTYPIPNVSPSIDCDTIWKEYPKVYASYKKNKAKYKNKKYPPGLVGYSCGSRNEVTDEKTGQCKSLPPVPK